MTSTADMLAAEQRHADRREREQRAAEVAAWVKWPTGGTFRRHGSRGQSAHAIAVAKPFTVAEWYATRDALAATEVAA